MCGFSGSKSLQMTPSTGPPDLFASTLTAFVPPLPPRCLCRTAFVRASPHNFLMNIRNIYGWGEEMY